MSEGWRPTCVTPIGQTRKQNEAYTVSSVVGKKGRCTGQSNHYFGLAQSEWMDVQQPPHNIVHISPPVSVMRCIQSKLKRVGCLKRAERGVSTLGWAPVELNLIGISRTKVTFIALHASCTYVYVGYKISRLLISTLNTTMLYRL